MFGYCNSGPVTGHIMQLFQELGLEHDRDKQCKKYSGGNKRKLSAAIALVGNPEMLLLVRNQYKY